eukprot:symbB.v1.2.005465.t1/scaffold260.1/size426026/16
MAGAFSSASAKAKGNSSGAGSKKERGNAFFRDGNHSKAVRAYDEAIRANPSDARCWANRAAAQMAMLAEFGRGLSPAALRTNPYYNNSLDDLKQSLKLDEKYIKAWARLGQLHAMASEFSEAMAAYEKGLALDPEHPDCLAGKRACLEQIIPASSLQHFLTWPRASRSMADTGAAAAADAAKAEAARLIQKAVRNSIVSDTGREISVVNLAGDVMLQKHVSSSLTVFMLKSEIAAAQGILSKEIHLSCSTRKLANHELLKDLEGEDVLTFTRVDYETASHHAASKIGGAWKRRR